MEEIIQFLAGILNREFIRAVFSNPRVKDNVVKAKLRPMEQKGELLFQLESFTKTQAFHKNLTVEETKDELAKLLEEFRQVQVETVSEDITVLLSKKGKATIKRKRKKVQAKAADLSHRIFRGEVGTFCNFAKYMVLRASFLFSADIFLKMVKPANQLKFISRKYWQRMKTVIRAWLC